MSKSEIRAEYRLSILFALFIGSVIAMNLLGGKITTLFGVPVSVSVFMVPITFLITDVVAEVYGKERTKLFVQGAIVSMVFVMLYSILFVSLPVYEGYEFGEQYATIFGNSVRLMVASIVAFTLSQMHDVWAFEFWKKKTNGKYLWLRNNLSTIVSQALDSVLFMMIAFYGVSEQFTMLFILQMSLSLYLFKVLFAILDTPFVYLGVRWLRR